MRLRPLPPMLTHVVHTALQVCDRTEYHGGGSCRSCGGTLSGYDTRVKRFALLFDESDHTVEVIIHRSYCRDCGRIWMPDDPFYPGTRVGSPVVDLCRTLAMTMTCGQVATRLGQMGVKVDRWSVRSYSCLAFAPPPMVAAFGINVPVSIISLSTLATTVGDAGRACGDDVLAACYYPSRTRSLSSSSVSGTDKNAGGM
ncbi:MAG: hypothetical protein WC593_10710 [Methanoregula sp.]